MRNAKQQLRITYYQVEIFIARGKFPGLFVTIYKKISRNRMKKKNKILDKSQYSFVFRFIIQFRTIEIKYPLLPLLNQLFKYRKYKKM